MQQYGYLAGGSPAGSALHTEEAVGRAVRALQEWGGLHPSGRLDSDTLALLSTPRCGNPDPAQARQKRYVIGGRGWTKRRITYKYDRYRNIRDLDYHSKSELQYDC